MDIVNTLEQHRNNIKLNIARQFKLTDGKFYSNLILINKGKILFLKRSNEDDVAPGKWCLPGGSIESNETPKQAAVRETIEETGFPLNYNAINTIVSLDLTVQKRKNFIIYYYRYRVPDYLLDSIVLENREHNQYIWMSPSLAVEELDLLFDLSDHLKKIFKIE